MLVERVRQLARSVRPSLVPRQAMLAAEWLLPNELRLFSLLGPYDRAHSLDVAGTLVRRGLATRPLMAAALLHDLGKAEASVHPLHRVTVVLVVRLHPALLEWLGCPSPHSWRFPLWVLRHHAELGACMAEEAGVEPAVVALIRDHHNPMAGPLVSILQMVDGGKRRPHRALSHERSVR